MDKYAVLVFRDQPFTDDQQLAFAQRLDGQLHSKTGTAALGLNRLGNDALVDISNLDERGRHHEGRRPPAGVRAREPPLAHRRVVPGSGRAATRCCPRRSSRPPAPTRSTRTCAAAYDALPAETKARLEGLRVHHSIAYSRQTLGFEFSPEEAGRLEGAVHPLVRIIPRSGRRSLYLASHASRIVDWPLPEGRLLLRDLTEHATQPEFVYRHRWAVGDLVIWDNRATMHRGAALRRHARTAASSAASPRSTSSRPRS